MKGEVLDYSIQENSGVISGEDGSRYTFAGSEWREEIPPTRGMSVDFDVQGGGAVAIYRISRTTGSSAIPGAKSKVTAGLLALFLGGLGIHKFYLGYTSAGLVYLLINTIGWFITSFLLGIPNIILGIIALIEGIIYLTKTDEEFEQIYVIGEKHWF